MYLTPIYKRHTYAHYLTVEQGGKLFKITGKQQAIMSPGVKHLHIKPKKGSILIPPISMGHRYAYLIANGPTSETAKRNALNAASKINFHFFKN
ncbi:MAG: hypothetical protein ACOX40_07205 [Bacilli bacterium]|nr:hypothetical protein [Acholeplasmataceae bacterium]